MKEEKTANLKDWVFFVGMVVFATAFFAQPILIGMDVHQTIVGCVCAISIAGLVAVILAVEPQKAKLKRYYPIVIIGMILLEIIVQKVTALIV